MNVEDTFNTTSFTSTRVNPSTGEVTTERFAVPRFRHRTIVDLQGYDDRERFKEPSMVDTDSFVPLSEKLHRFFPNGFNPSAVKYDGIQDDDTTIDMPDNIVDAVDFDYSESVDLTGVAPSTPVKSEDNKKPKAGTSAESSKEKVEASASTSQSSLDFEEEA